MYFSLPKSVWDDYNFNKRFDIGSIVQERYTIERIIMCRFCDSDSEFISDHLEAKNYPELEFLSLYNKVLSEMIYIDKNFKVNDAVVFLKLSEIS